MPRVRARLGHFKIRPRFIYKSFYDYFFLLFNIPIESKLKLREECLKKKITELGINSKLLTIINDMKNLYDN